MRNKSLSLILIIISVLMVSLPSYGSSHREAPFITEMPKVDGTDFYLFRSYEEGRDGFVTIIANYVPLQDGFGGPNYFTLDPEAVYDIKIDNDGDSVEDLTFRFQAMNTLKDITLNVGGQAVSVPFRNVGVVGPGTGDNASLNEEETYTLTLIRGTGKKAQSNTITNVDNGSRIFEKPIDNFGNKSIPDYDAYANNHIFNINIPGCSQGGKVFVGQRNEPFFLDLGGVFDLVNYNPLGSEQNGPNQIENKNITSFVLEVPTSCLIDGDDPVIGGWTTSSVPRKRVLSRFPTFSTPSKERGMLVQVSRLANPLVNELVIGLKDKNRFNSSQPKDDGQFLTYVTNPTLPAVLEILFGEAAGYVAPTKFPRQDLVDIFLTGVEGLNKPSNISPSEQMRLNTAIDAVPADQQNNLGVIAGDNAGYPNGRRPGDDVVDISLRAVSGVLLDEADAPAGQLPFNDGVTKTAKDFGEVFPYLNSPIPGGITGATAE